MKNDIAIKVNSVNKSYRLYDKPQDRLKEVFNLFKKKYYHEFNALRDINFEIKKGETVGVIGKNGAGKSTLLKIITNVLTPTSGFVETHGKISSLLELGAGFNPELSGIENIFLNGILMGYSEDEMKLKQEAIIEFADIGEFIQQPVKSYSSGMFARLAFSVAINVKPDILIVDEALSVGDIFFQQKCFNYIKTKLDNVTKILVTHDMASLTQMADRVIVIDKGSVMYDGEPLEAIKVYQQDEHRKINYKVENDIIQSYDNCTISALNTISEENLTGLLEIKIIGHMFLVNGEPNEVVNENDNVELLLDVQSSRDSKGRCVLGLLFRDKQAQMVFGENTLQHNLQNIDIKKGLSRIGIKFKWPSIRRGEYTYTPGIGEVNPDNDLEHNIQCWANNIGKIYSTTGQKHDCLFSLQIDKIDIKDIKEEKND